MVGLFVTAAGHLTRVFDPVQYHFQGPDLFRHPSEKLKSLFRSKCRLSPLVIWLNRHLGPKFTRTFTLRQGIKSFLERVFERLAIRKWS